MSASIENLTLGEKIYIAHRRLLGAHPFHLQALSILFLLPVFLSLVLYPCFHRSLFHPHSDFTTFTRLEIIVFLSYALFVDLIFLCGIATITYSTVQAFYDRPVTLVSSITSIRNSFLPLVSTLIVSQAVSVLITVPLVTIFVFVARALYSDQYFVIYVIPMFFGLLSIQIGLQLDWSLAYVVAVVESKSGLEAMSRSACLVKGNRWVTFPTSLLYGVVIGGMVIGGSVHLVTITEPSKGGSQWRRSAVITQIVESSVLSYVAMLVSLVRRVALYMYLKNSKSVVKDNDDDDDEMSRALV